MIVGGGSAGWLTAGLLAAEYPQDGRSDVSVTLVESPNVKIIGVGEGTWPTMRTTLRKIGVSEAEFLKACSAAFKQGTRFNGWVSGEKDDYYYHPFSAPAAYSGINLVPHWQPRRDEVSFVNAVSPQGYLCDRGLAPKQATTPEYAGVANYGYHLDAAGFASLLQQHCTQNLGVRHIFDHVSSINGTSGGDIHSVRTAAHGDIEGDLFIDCTGFAALLIGKHFQVPFIDKRDVLFNDSALAVQVPYSSPDASLACQTTSTARDAGWIWDIGLTTRRGIGYTYSSAHMDDAAAERTLLEYIARSPGLAQGAYTPRKISFRPGHRAKFWHRNCVAVGMSAGFLEPLEASALVLIELAGRMLSEELPADRAAMDIISRRYNDKFQYRWNRIIDFLKLHYVLSKRSDTDYWLDNKRPETTPESLQDLLVLWEHHVPWHNDFPQRDEVFSSASHQYVLYGMGFRTKPRKRARDAVEKETAHRLFAENSSQAEKLLRNLPEHRQLLENIGTHGLPKS